jgi:cytochrome c oxidase assembly factor CtaG
MTAVLAHIDPIGASVVVLGTLGAIAAYAAGDRPGWPAWEAASFAAGLLVVNIALLGPIDHRAETSFAVHMVQHLLLVEVGAVLLVLGRPLRRFTVLLGRGRRARHWTTPRQALRNGFAAWIAFAVVLWIWHLPALYDLALDHPTVHGVEHLTLLAAALWFWTAVVVAVRGRRQAIAAVGLATTGMHTAILGALFVFASRSLIPTYDRANPHGALQDQQLAGLWMWIGASPVVLGGVLVSVALALRAADRAATLEARLA